MCRSVGFIKMSLPIKIIIFVKNKVADEFEKTVHDRLTEHGLQVFVDSVHGQDYNWFKTNFKQTNCRFYWKEMDGLPFDFMPKTVEENVPTMVAYFDDDAKIEIRDWVYITSSLKHIVTDCYISPHHLRIGQSFVVTKDHLPMAVDVKDGEDEVVLITKSTPPDDEDRLHYALRTHHVPNRDAKLFELWKPHCDIPFTVMIQPYSTKGDIPFFSSLFACSSWGVARLDAEFLKHVWKDMGMPGLLDLDALLKKHTEECMPGDGNAQPTVEPKVYRSTIELVLKNLDRVDEGKVRVKRYLDETEKMSVEKD